ncbi:hypothetical protein MTHERMOG20_25500 [Moorella thermoacetica]|nr:hypothetical protein MOTHE_c03240 [Moorella thermoacetica]OIQ53146.1 hypothetical protein MOCA_25890 [Moorella thermoacetica]QCZ99595.1 hypothetical protein MothHH_00427 [Moorella thermoacetica]TYL06655.1 hypothetical protein MOLA_25540 [Moorella thermoacetica]TYL15009.1 hypothetical protein MOCE_15660 [Moorella thermoacetica]
MSGAYVQSAGVNPTLMQHYSTKESLGSGFTLMLYYTDELYLATGNSGTTLVLNFCQVAGQKAC